MKQMLTVTLTDMSVLPEDSRAGRFSAALNFTLDYKNNGPEDIRAFTGVMTFADLFDRPMKRINVTHEAALPAGQSFTERGKSYQINQFMNEDRWLTTTPLASMRVSFEPTSILLSNGQQIGRVQQ